MNCTQAMELSLLISWLFLVAFHQALSNPVLLKKSSQVTTSVLDDINLDVSRPLTKMESEGGPNGVEFDDFELLGFVIGVHSINLSFTDQINSILVTYYMSGGLLISSPVHGKPVGQWVNITLDPQEFIWKVEGQTDGSYITLLTFRTTFHGNINKTYGPYGHQGNFKFTFEKSVVAFHGRSGDSLSSVGIYGLQNLNKSRRYGAPGGNGFDDGLLFRIPPVVGIHSITIWNGVIIDGIQVEFIGLDGKIILGTKHGSGNSQNSTKITFDPGETIIAINGTADSRRVCQLRFTTRTTIGLRKEYGPFGNTQVHPFSFSGTILGFQGQSRNQINMLGVFYVLD